MKNRIRSPKQKDKTNQYNSYSQILSGKYSSLEMCPYVYTRNLNWSSF